MSKKVWTPGSRSTRDNLRTLTMFPSTPNLLALFQGHRSDGFPGRKVGSRSGSRILPGTGRRLVELLHRTSIFYKGPLHRIRRRPGDKESFLRLRGLTPLISSRERSQVYQNVLTSWWARVRLSRPCATSVWKDIPLPDGFHQDLAPGPAERHLVRARPDGNKYGRSAAGVADQAEARSLRAKNLRRGGLRVSSAVGLDFTKDDGEHLNSQPFQGAGHGSEPFRVLLLERPSNRPQQGNGGKKGQLPQLHPPGHSLEEM